VAKVLENSFELARTCIGSPFYISPEICENLLYDRKSDIWALGCVLFELTTLKYAFTAKNMKTLIAKITMADHNSLPPNTNPKIRGLIKKLLNKNPKQRPVVTEILEDPFLKEFKDKVPCRTKIPFPSVRIRDDFKIKQQIQNNLKFRATPTQLPISKSSINLNQSELTQPEAKYKATGIVKPRFRKPTFWKSFDSKLDQAEGVDHPRDIPNSSKKMKRTGSLYFNLIDDEKNKHGSKEKNVNLIRNIFSKDYRSFGSDVNVDIERKDEDIEAHRKENGKFESEDNVGECQCKYILAVLRTTVRRYQTTLLSLTHSYIGVKVKACTHHACDVTDTLLTQIYD